MTPGGAFENGWLLTVAITGRMFQYGAFGTTGPEMWQPGGAFEDGRLRLVAIMGMMSKTDIRHHRPRDVAAGRRL